MADKTIFTVGFELPTDKFEFIPINSNRALADADIILIEATLTSDNYNECKRYNSHWFSEITTAYQAGKTIFIYLPTKTIVKKPRYTDTVNSFEIIPMRKRRCQNKQGRKVKPTKEGKLLTNYWSLAGAMSNYEVTFDFDATPLLMTNDNTNIVGAYITEEDVGTMFFLPPIRLAQDFSVPTGAWSDKGEQFGHQFFKEIIALDKAVKSTEEQSPEPEWLHEPEFILDKEEQCYTAISDKEEAIGKLYEEIDTLREELAKVTIPKRLLYETGIPLEKAIIHGLRIIGFEADNFQDAESEFDIVFSSSDTCRFLGESEGKDTKHISADKYRQLEINLQEDYHKEDGNDEFANGVLFANGYRLLEPSKRKVGFTDKVQTSAKRSGISLVHTTDLFNVVKYLQDTNDQDYAKAVRECFRDTEGVIMEFPPIPTAS